jgi:16S rRNA (uracil1498-N3)-methyltransferase
MLRVPLTALSAGERRLSAEVARYVARVHRLRVGDRFIAFDPEARLEAEASVESIDDGVVVALAPPRPATRIARRSVTVIQALAKSSKVDAVVRDATELGATRVMPAVAERSVKRGGDVERWRRISVEAARQAGRGDVPRVDDVQPLASALEQALEDRALLVVLEPTAEHALAALLRGAGAVPVVLVVGPEGGLSPAELELAASLGYRTAKLGPFTLRTETACAAALGAIAALT